MNGGSAFPSPGVVLDNGRGEMVQQGAYEGMSLRDYFAAKVVGDIALNNLNAGFYYDAAAAAQLAYEVADAMIAERAK